MHALLYIHCYDPLISQLQCHDKHCEPVKTMRVTQSTWRVEKSKCVGSREVGIKKGKKEINQDSSVSTVMYFDVSRIYCSLCFFNCCIKTKCFIHKQNIIVYGFRHTNYSYLQPSSTALKNREGKINHNTYSLHNGTDERKS